MMPRPHREILVPRLRNALLTLALAAPCLAASQPTAVEGDAPPALAQPRAAEADAPRPPPPSAAASPEAPPRAEPPGTPWWRNLRLSAYLGTSWAYGTTYGNLGVGVGYMIALGLTPTVEVGVWFGGSPSVTTLKPGLDWYVPLPGQIRPYLGAYWAQWFVGGGNPDQGAYGFRGGLSFARMGPASLTFGIAYEHAYSGCTSGCSYWFPQVGAGFSL
jgi:hypothetical protein